MKKEPTLQCAQHLTSESFKFNIYCQGFSIFYLQIRCHLDLPDRSDEFQHARHTLHILEIIKIEETNRLAFASLPVCGSSYINDSIRSWCRGSQVLTPNNLEEGHDKHFWNQKIPENLNTFQNFEKKYLKSNVAESYVVDLFCFQNINKTTCSSLNEGKTEKIILYYSYFFL